MLGARAPTPARACGPSAAGRGLRGALAGLSLASPRPCALAGSLPVLGAAPRGGRAAAPGRGALHVCAGSREVGIGLMGNKAGMTSYFTKEGLQVPVTVIALLEGNIVTQVKTEQTDGYSAVQVGYDAVRLKADRPQGLQPWERERVNKPELGHLAKSGAPPMRKLAEYRLPSVDGFAVGQKLQAGDLFKVGDLVDVSGTTIGKGFQGATKRHGFARGLMTHGSKSHRAPGAIGGNTAGRVYAFQRMPGQMGNETVKVRKLEVLRVSADCLLVKGSVPGKPGHVLRVTPAKIVGKSFKFDVVEAQEKAARAAAKAN